MAFLLVGDVAGAMIMVAMEVVFGWEGSPGCKSRLASRIEGGKQGPGVGGERTGLVPQRVPLERTCPRPQ